MTPRATPGLPGHRMNMGMRTTDDESAFGCMRTPAPRVLVEDCPRPRCCAPARASRLRRRSRRCGCARCARRSSGAADVPSTCTHVVCVSSITLSRSRTRFAMIPATDVEVASYVQHEAGEGHVVGADRDESLDVRALVGEGARRDVRRRDGEAAGLVERGTGGLAAAQASPLAGRELCASLPTVGRRRACVPPTHRCRRACVTRTRFRDV